MKNIKKVLVAVGMFSLLMGAVTYGAETWNDLSSKILEGRKYLGLTWGVFGFFVIWQIKGLIAFFRTEEQAHSRLIIKILLIASTVIGVVTLSCFNYWLLNPDPESLEAVREMKELPVLKLMIFTEDMTPLGVLRVLFFWTISFIGANGIFFCYLMLGRVGVGASVAIGLHNWLNGGTLDIGIVLQSLAEFFLEVGVSDLAAIFYTGIWFAINSYLFGGTGE